MAAIKVLHLSLPVLLCFLHCYAQTDRIGIGFINPLLGRIKIGHHPPANLLLGSTRSSMENTLSAQCSTKFLKELWFGLPTETTRHRLVQTLFSESPAKLCSFMEMVSKFQSIMEKTRAMLQCPTMATLCCSVPPPPFPYGRASILPPILYCLDRFLNYKQLKV